jgi:uncharacterized membrane protein
MAPVPSHSHAPQSSSPGGESDTGVRRLLTAALLPLIVLTLIGFVWLWPSGAEVEVPEGFSTERARGTVLEVPPCGPTEVCTAQVQLTSGVGAPAEVAALVPVGEQAPTIEVGDDLVLVHTPEAPPGQQYQFFDYDRSTTLLILVAVFVLAVLALTRWRGLASLGALVISVLVVVQFVLPALLEGSPPVLVAVVGAGVIMIVTLYLTHGLTIRTSVALLGTLLSLALTGGLGAIFTGITKFTGQADEINVFLGVLISDLDIRGLLLAGLVIGALGVLDDVTVTQAAAVWELADAQPSATRRSLFAAAMRIGRSHVQATVNTLVLAYVGASLPLLLIFTVTDVGLVDALTTEVIATEILRGLVGGIGIVAAVPLTTAVAAMTVRPR